MEQLWFIVSSSVHVSEGIEIFNHDQLALNDISIISSHPSKELAWSHLKNFAHVFAQDLLMCGETISVKEEDNAIIINSIHMKVIPTVRFQLEKFKL